MVSAIRAPGGRVPARFPAVGVVELPGSPWTI